MNDIKNVIANASNKLRILTLDNVFVRPIPRQCSQVALNDG
jgi:hypothetical protein